MYSDGIANDFISQLVDDGLSSVPWKNSTFTDDFIMLAEFSELEGPKHIFTVPRDVNCKFDLDSFAVRIMSVDCVSILQTSDMASFNIAGDIQVVLSEVSEGAVAYVHHFVLYDVRARGYVRPYCLAYVTRDQTRVMKLFESLLQTISLVSSLFHFGNAVSFINDLVTRWQHLHYLNTVIADKSANIYVHDKVLTPHQKESIIEKDIDENLSQLVDLHQVFLAYLDRELFTEHRDIFYERYKQIIAKKMEPFTREEARSLTRDETRNFTRDDESVTSFSDYCDASVNAPVANSHDIPEDVIGSLLGKKYDKPLRQLNELTDATYSSGLQILKTIIRQHSTANVNIATSIRFKLPTSIDHASRERNPDSELNGSRDVCYVPVQKSPSLKQFLNATFCPVLDPTRRSASSAFEIENSFLSSLTMTSLEQPIMMRNNSLVSTTGSFVSISSANRFEPGGGGSDISSSGSYRDTYTSSDLSPDSSLTLDSEYDKISLTQSSFGSGYVQENNDFLKYTKISLLGLKRRFSFLAHAVFSILIGRPVVILGEEKHKHKVRHLVFGLANFIPCKASSKTVIPWLNGSFSHSQLSTPGIIGMQKCPRGRDVPNSLKPYVTIFDVEDETLLAPKYDGKFLHDIFNPNSYFPSDVAYRQFILQSFAEIYSPVFLRFIKMYGQPASVADTLHSPEHGIGNCSYNKSTQRKEARGDEYIIVAFLKTMEDEVLLKYSSNGHLRRTTTKLNTMQCTLFHNNKRKK